MQTRTLSSAEKLAWIRLIMSENIGPITLFRLLKQFGNAEVAIDYVEKIAQNKQRQNILVCSLDKAKKELELAFKQNTHIIALIEPEYPELLRYVEDAPPILYAKGNLGVLQNKQIALVGARNASLSGKNLAKTIARDLSLAGLTITSGLARGIDSAAHNGALSNTANNAASTIAVLASGVDVVYPPENQELYENICARGVVVSEMPMGTQPLAHLFPRRNRIISGMSIATAIIEAEEKSGSLITARLALEQGREVFAVPGNPLDPRSKGTNRLLRDGANMLENAQDILNNLSAPVMREPDLFEFTDKKFEAKDIKDNSLLKDKILENLSSVACDMDDLLAEVNCDLAAFSLALLELELEGLAERQSGNKIIKL